MFKQFFLVLVLLHLVFMVVMPASAFQQGGCGDGECRSCHHMSKKGAAALLSLKEDNIVDLKIADVPGFWEVDIRQRGKVLPVFIDFSKQYLISGSIIKIADKQNVTGERFAELNRVDVAQIPLDDALLIGSSTATTRIIVFDDPQCPYCSKLQTVMKQVVDQHPDIAFFIKLFPLKMHPDSYTRARAIVCAKSVAMLEASLTGKALEPPTCETDQVDKNIELAAKIGIRSTPTLVFPDGRVVPGYKPGKAIIRILENRMQKRSKTRN